MRRGPALALLATTVALFQPACESSPAKTSIGPDCRALLDAAERAKACDPALAAAAESLAQQPDEAACQDAARAILDPEPTDRGVRSRFDVGRTRGRLSDLERAAVVSLPLPATLLLRPDLAPEPGRPKTSVALDGQLLVADEDGSVRFVGAPGGRTITLRHAGQERDFCVLLTSCNELSLVTHGSGLPHHPAVRAGPCSLAPSPDVQDSGFAAYSSSSSDSSGSSSPPP